MCGRYRIKDTDVLTEHLRASFGIPDWVMTPRYNMAPSQDLPVIALGEDGRPAVTTMRWGLVPFWDKSAKPKLAPINAQAEKVVTNGMFRHAVQAHRCVVPADGFYEWLRLDEKTKVPFDIHFRDRRPFYMAGIYEPATPGRPATYAVLTTSANEMMAKIHSRMPAILDLPAARRWLAPGVVTESDIATLTAPAPADQMEANPVSSLVNSPRNDVPECIEPVAFTPPPRQDELF